MLGHVWSFSLGLNLEADRSKLTLEKFANIWQIEQAGVRAMKFETAQMSFLSDVFAAVAVVVAWASYYLTVFSMVLFKPKSAEFKSFSEG